MKIIIRNLNTIISIIPVSLFILSCDTDANLAKVQEFSQNAELIEQTLPVIADDFYQSCLRAAQYKPVVVKTIASSEIEDNLSLALTNEQIFTKIENINQQLINESSNLQVKQLLQELKKQSNRQPLTRKVAQENCNKKQKIRTTNEEQVPSIYLGSLMKNGNSIIALYMKKLGTLASDDSVNLDRGFNSLSANLIGLDSKLAELFAKIPEESDKNSAQLVKRNEQIKAGSNLANLIVNQIFDGKRIDTLNEAITVANEPLKNYAEGLQTVVREVYINQYLKNEESSLDEYYSDYLIEILDNYEENQNNSVINLTNTIISIDRDRWHPEKKEIQERRNLAMSYINLLQTVIDGHEQLAAIYDDGQQPSSEQLQAIIETNSKAVKDFVDKSQALK